MAKTQKKMHVIKLNETRRKTHRVLINEVNFKTERNHRLIPRYLSKHTTVIPRILHL